MTRWWPSWVCSVRRNVSVLVRPSRIATVRWTCSDTNASWVTMMIVVPSALLMPRSSPNTSADVAESSSPVGSSARTTDGSFARATAIDTRCCSPPDRRSGPVRRAVAEADELQQLEGARSAAASARRGPSAARRSRPRSGTAAGCGSSAATRTRRSGAGSGSAPRSRACRGRSRRRPPGPADGTSIPPRIPSSVDLPLPDAPTIATISPCSTSRSRPWSATTSRSASL